MARSSGLPKACETELASLGVCQVGVIADDALAHDELVEDGVDGPHVAVPLQEHHVAGAELRVDIERAMLHEMAHRLDAVAVAPLGDSAVHRAAPRFGEGREILVAGGGLVVAGQLELVGDEGLLPIDLPLVEHAAELGAPIAAGLRLVVEESADGLAELGAEMVVVRLVDGRRGTNRRSPCSRRRR